MYTVAELTTWPVEDLEKYIRGMIPKNEHFWATREQLILIAAKIMDANGQLNPDDSRIINTPGFDRIFVLEKGDLSASIAHLSIDVGLSSLGELASI